MKIIKSFIDLVAGKETDVTREEAEKVRKKRDNEVYEEFKKSINGNIKQNCRYDSSMMVELIDRAVIERKDELVRFYREELGYDVVLIDDEILGKGSGKVFLFISWGEGTTPKSLYTYDNK